MAREKRILVKCYDDEFETIQTKATSLSKQPATYLRELGLQQALPSDQVQLHLYWLAGIIHESLNSWIKHHPSISTSLLNEMQQISTALKTLQGEALINQLPPDEINANFTEAIRNAHQSYQK